MAAMMLGTVLGIIYVVARFMVPCLPSFPLTKDVLITDKYLGKWYYVGVASWDEEDIAVFQSVDSSVAELKSSENDTLIMTGALREGDECVTRAWTYKLNPKLDPIMVENGHFGVAWDGKWINCPSCLILGKLHPEEAILRLMLFARSEEIPNEVVETFKEKLECFFVINDFIIAPRTKEFCKLEGTD